MHVKSLWTLSERGTVVQEELALANFDERSAKERKKKESLVRDSRA